MGLEDRTHYHACDGQTVLIGGSTHDAGAAVELDEPQGRNDETHTHIWLDGWPSQPAPVQTRDALPQRRPVTKRSRWPDN
jgi:hypothetical protein